MRGYVADGMVRDHIAAALGITENTLRKHYADDLESSDEDWKETFRASLKRDVVKSDCAPALRIFAAKVLLGWRETVAIDPSKEPKPEDMTDDELRRAIAARERQRSARPRVAAAS